MISVDSKKKELIGHYKNAGHRWRPAGQPVKVKTHDFPGQAEKAIPYGIYDTAVNTGWVSIGTDHDTATFAVASIRRWWRARGRHDYPRARWLLITADGGGSNGYRTRGWKTQPSSAPRSNSASAASRSATRGRTPRTNTWSSPVPGPPTTTPSRTPSTPETAIPPAPPPRPATSRPPTQAAGRQSSTFPASPPSAPEPNSSPTTAPPTCTATAQRSRT